MLHTGHTAQCTHCKCYTPQFGKRQDILFSHASAINPAKHHIGVGIHLVANMRLTLSLHTLWVETHRQTNGHWLEIGWSHSVKIILWQVGWRVIKLEYIGWTNLARRRIIWWRASLIILAHLSALWRQEGLATSIETCNRLSAPGHRVAECHRPGCVTADRGTNTFYTIEVCVKTKR